MIVLQIIGLILLGITYYIHKHTLKIDKRWVYGTGGYEYSSTEIKSPLYMWLFAFIISITPFINFIAFIVGTMGYFLACNDEAIEFQYDTKSKSYKILSKIKTILTKDV